jgi:hypothetical protein
MDEHAPQADGELDEIREPLASASTATVQNQLFKRGLRNTFLFGLGPLSPKASRFVARAFTLRYIPAREDIDTLEVFADPAHPQRRAVETVPPGSALVMECRGDAQRRVARGHPRDAHARSGRRGRRDRRLGARLAADLAAPAPRLLGRSLGVDQSRAPPRRRLAGSDRLRRSRPARRS